MYMINLKKLGDNGWHIEGGVNTKTIEMIKANEFVEFNLTIEDGSWVRYCYDPNYDYEFSYYIIE